MFSLRDFVIFFAGAEFFHTISHIFLWYSVALPLQTKFVLITSSLNMWAVLINALITVALLWWASRLAKK